MAKHLPGLSLVALVLLVATCAAQPPGQTVGIAGGHASPADRALRPVVTTSELVVGQNRLAFGLLQNNTLLEDAKVVVRLYEMTNQQVRLKAEMPALYDKLRIVEQGNRVHVHADGTRHVHNETTDIRGLYVTQVIFEKPGIWGLEIVAKQGDERVQTARFAVNVLAAPFTPTLGAPAPRSRNRITSNISGARQIDTSDPLDSRLHQVRIADAIAQRKPQVMVFATPQFCTTRLCGPVMDVVRTLIPAYGDRVVFTHEEIWQDFSAHKRSPAVEEWRLPSEPWIFIVDGQGVVRAKFEGLVTEHEIETVLKRVLALE